MYNLGVTTKIFLYRAVAKARGNDPAFLRLLSLLEDPNASDEEREEAERLVQIAVQEFGEWIGHGDLLTVKMVQEARSSMAGSATAFEQLKFLGPFRLQLLHMKMKKVVHDYSSGMPSEINFDDVITLPWMAALTRMRVTNKGKDIKKNDSTFERHDQFIAAVQASYLANLFDNYHKNNPEKIRSLSSLKDAVSYIWEMLDSFNVHLYFDPDKGDRNLEGQDDMFVYCQDMVTRFLLSLAFDVCEEEGDSEGLRALRRTMVCYFLNSNKGKINSKYASFTLIDLIVELSSSKRTRKRMDLYVTINPTGSAGGGLFRDKHIENCVRSVKRLLRGTHGLLDDLKLEKEVGGLSVTTEIVEHNRRSVLRGKLGKEHSSDMVGEEVREQLEVNIAKYDPFNRERAVKYVYKDKPFGGPYNGLSIEVVERFIENRRSEYNQKYL